MTSTGRQEVKARNSRETDILSDCENMDVILGGEKISSLERELANSELRLKILAVRMGPLGEMDSWSLWKRYQGN